MRVASSLIALILCATAVRAQEEADPGETAMAPVAGSPPPRDRAARDRWLTAQLDALTALPGLGGARLGVAVTDVASGRLLYGKNPDDKLKLASTAKIVTAVGALSLLGPEYRFRTTLFADTFAATGVITGNLYLRGSGDPSLDTEGLWAMVHDLEVLGVKRVTGAVVVDEGFFDGQTMPPVFDEKTEDAYFRAPVGAASVNGNAVWVRVLPGATVGAPARVIADPFSRYLVVVNHATTVATGRSTLMVASRGVAGATEITVSGTIRAGDLDGQAVRKRIEHPALYTGATLRALLDRAGIKVAATDVRIGTVPPRARPLTTRQSPSVGVLVRDMAKTSDNFMAETLLKTVGAEAGGVPGTWDKGRAAVRQRLAELGIAESSYRYENGSGLYSSDFFGAATLNAVLRAGALDFRYGPDLISALGIAGADGTLRNRMVGGPAERYVRAKSGSLKGVRCLAGYAGGVGRPLVAFSVLVNDAPDTPSGTRAARALADGVAETLVRYLEAD